MILKKKVSKHDERVDWSPTSLGEIMKLRKDKHQPDKVEQLYYIGLEHIEKYTGNLLPTAEAAPINTVKNKFYVGDILYGKLRPYLSKTILAKKSGVCSTDILVFKNSDVVLPELLYQFLLSRKFVDDASANCSGVNLPRVSTKYIQSYSFNLPPLPEQRFIVTKLDTLFSELDAGIAAFAHAKKQLKVYRQSILKQAFSGELTREWRELQVGLPTAEEFLKRIEEDRSVFYGKKLEEWERLVSKWDESGRVGRKPTKPRKQKEINLPEGLDKVVNEFPNSWGVTPLGTINDIVGGVTKGRKLEGRSLVSLPYLRVANVQDGYLDLAVVKSIDVLPDDLEKYRLLYGDILYTEGGDKDKLGRGTIWKNQVPDCIHQNHIFRARPVSKGVDSQYVSFYSQTKAARNYFFSKAKQTTNLASINMTVLSELPVVLCSIEEQRQIVQEIETRFSVCDQLEADIELNLKKSESLRQSLLKKAFDGELLTKAELAACRAEADWEPAGVLLERIKNKKKAKTK